MPASVHLFQFSVEMIHHLYKEQEPLGLNTAILFKKLVIIYVDFTSIECDFASTLYITMHCRKR